MQSVIVLTTGNGSHSIFHITIMTVATVYILSSSVSACKINSIQFDGFFIQSHSFEPEPEKHPFARILSQ